MPTLGKEASILEPGVGKTGYVPDGKVEKNTEKQLGAFFNSIPAYFFRTVPAPKTKVGNGTKNPQKPSISVCICRIQRQSVSYNYALPFLPKW